MHSKYILFLFIITISISCSDHSRDNILDRKKIKKKSIVVGDAKFDGPEKYMYYHAAVKHGNIDISKP